jgi:hypothetical protein
MGRAVPEYAFAGLVRDSVSRNIYNSSLVLRAGRILNVVFHGGNHAKFHSLREFTAVKRLEIAGCVL